MPHKKKKCGGGKHCGCSNKGKYDKVGSSNFAGPAGGSCAGTFPVNTIERARSALRHAHYAPKPQGIRNFVYKKYPSLRPKKR